MTNFLKLFFFLSVFFAKAQSYTVKTAAIKWKAYKTLGAKSANHFGILKLKSGTMVFKDGNLAGGSFSMDMNSITADDLKDDPKYKNMLERHLKSDDFFDVARFPVSTFQIKSVKKTAGTNNYKITGALTVKGVSKNISFPAKVLANENGATFSSEQFTFNRKDFGLKYNIFEDMLISNQVEINVDLTAK